eukprot:2331121-Prymnesium_polylepis.1
MGLLSRFSSPVSPLTSVPRRQPPRHPSRAAPCPSHTQPLHVCSPPPQPSSHPPPAPQWS